MDKPLTLDSSQTLYLLGQIPAISTRYRQLMENCALLGDFLSFETTKEWLSCYERDAQSLHTKLPLLVFRPHTVETISFFVQACYRLNISVTMRCGGTGLAGSSIPSAEGIILLTQHFKKIKHYDAEKGMIGIEPGVTVRQLNDHVESDQWIFPLVMATEGVAGLAGCLSSQARGYHQQQSTLFDAIESVKLVDGEGHIHEVPSALVCGAEGRWGIIIEMKIQLKRRPSQCLDFIYSGPWQQINSQLPTLRSLYSLAYLTWWEDKFYIGLEGDTWRLTPTSAYLTHCLPGIQPRAPSLDPLPFSFLPSQQPFIVLSSVFYSSKLPFVCQWSKAEAQLLQLECQQQADVLAGSLHLILQSKDNLYSFMQKVEQFLVLWANFVDDQEGELASCHGVGMQMRPYMTPFWKEETQKIWHQLQLAFDPGELFGKERFFPPKGKSLEKVKQR